MADVELTYKGNTIGSLSASGTLTLETAGKYCEADIGLTYTAPAGGSIGAVIKYDEYTIASDQITSGTDGTQKFYNDYLDISNLPQDAIVLCIVDNTAFEYAGSTPDYAAVYAIRTLSPDTKSYKRYNGSTTTSTSNSYSFFLGAGSVVYRYVFSFSTATPFSIWQGGSY